MAIRLTAKYFKLIGGKVPSKYRSRVTEYNGVKYHSKKEADYAAGLDFLMRAGEIRAWTRQVKIPLIVHDHLIATYVVDFAVIRKDGSKELVEVKGFVTEIYKLKRKLFEAVYLRENPEIRYTVEH